MAEVFRSAMTEAHLINSATVSVIAGQFVTVGKYKVEAGELITIGYGQQSGQNNAQGRIFMDFKDDVDANIQGLVRLSVYSPQDRPLVILGEWRSETLRSGATDRALKIPLPENFTWLSEDKQLFLELQADVGATLSKANSEILLDTTTETV